MLDRVALRVALQQERAVELDAHLTRLLPALRGDERALDAGCGTGALSVALASRLAEVVGIDSEEAYVDAARAAAPANCTFVVGDVTALPFAYGGFDLAGCLRVLHHVRRPELVVAELARVTRPGGLVLIVDQLGATDPQSRPSSIASSGRVTRHISGCCPTPTCAGSSMPTISWCSPTR